MPIQSKDLISNQKPIDGWMNPLEKHSFYHKVNRTPPPNFIKDISWSISGDIPKNLSIDSNGVIKGDICHFGKQPQTQDNKPLDIIEYDGSNSKNNGRYRFDEFDFKFTITRKGIIKPGSSFVVFTETSNVYIKVIKNFGIDSLLFLRQYLDSGKSLFAEVKGEILELKPSIVVDNIKYTDSSSAIEVLDDDFQELNC